MVGLFATLERLPALVYGWYYDDHKPQPRNSTRGTPRLPRLLIELACRSSTNSLYSTQARVVIQLCHHLHITEEFYCGLV